MADTKISALSSGAPAQATDETVVARSGANYKLTVANIVGYLGSPITVANGGTGVSNITGIIKGSGTSAFSAATAGTDYAKPDTASTWTAVQTFRAASAVRSEAAATQDAVVLAGRAGGTNSYAVTLTPTTLSASRTMTLPDANTTVPVFTQVITFSGPSAARTVTLPDENFSVGFRNVPQSGSAKTTSYSLATGDVGKFIEVGASGSITIPDATFAAGDVVSIFNNTSGAITITCTITTAYIAGTDADKATVSLATRGVATILFLSGTVCVINGNVS